MAASESRPNTIGGRSLRVYYDESLRRLIIKLLDGPYEVAGVRLDRRLSAAFEEAIVGTGSKRIKETPRSKEPDHSWRPRTLPANPSAKWPTLVVECEWSESSKRLRIDAEWWLVHSRGAVQVVTWEEAGN